MNEKKGNYMSTKKIMTMGQRAEKMEKLHNLLEKARTLYTQLDYYEDEVQSLSTMIDSLHDELMEY